MEREKQNRPINEDEIRNNLCKNCKWMDEKEYDLRFEVCRCYNPKNIVERQNKIVFDHMSKKSIACYYFEKRTEENKEDHKQTKQYELFLKGFYQ